MVDDVKEVGVAAGSGLDEGNSSGGVRAEHLNDPVTFAGDEPLYFSGDIDGLGPSSGPKLDDLRVQRQTV